MAITFEEAAKRGLVKRVPNPNKKTTKKTKVVSENTYSSKKQSNTNKQPETTRIIASPEAARVLADIKHEDASKVIVRRDKFKTELPEDQYNKYKQLEEEGKQNEFYSATRRPAPLPSITRIKVKEETTNTTKTQQVKTDQELGFKSYTVLTEKEKENLGITNNPLTTGQSVLSDYGYSYLKREKAHFVRMERITNLGNKLTFGKGTEYKERGVIGQFAENTLSSTLAVGPAIINAADKAIFTGLSLTIGGNEQRKETTAEMLRAAKSEEFWSVYGKTRNIGGKDIFIPFSTPESFTTFVFAATGAAGYTYGKFNPQTSKTTPRTIKPKIKTKPKPDPIKTFEGKDNIYRADTIKNRAFDLFKSKSGEVKFKPKPETITKSRYKVKTKGSEVIKTKSDLTIYKPKPKPTPPPPVVITPRSLTKPNGRGGGSTGGGGKPPAVIPPTDITLTKTEITTTTLKGSEVVEVVNKPSEIVTIEEPFIKPPKPPEPRPTKPQPKKPTPKPKTPIGGFILPDLDFSLGGGLIGKYGRGTKPRGQKKTYLPSLTALNLGITGAKPTGRLSGLEQRPILKKKSKKDKDKNNNIKISSTIFDLSMRV
jgi:hypothetical protein